MRLFRAFAMVGSIPMAIGCASAGVPAVRGEPVADPSTFVADLRAASIPATPHQVNFAWQLDESGSRARGRGVVRVEAPERIRLDLFGPRGETYLVAALVESEYRLPPNVTAAVALPSPSLLWAALGVLEPPSGSRLSSANLDGSMAEVRYAAPDGDLYLFNFTGGDGNVLRLASLERAASRGVLETVTLHRDSAGAILSSEYRDWSAFRNLTLEVESFRATDPFPASIWRPDAEVR